MIQFILYWFGMCWFITLKIIIGKYEGKMFSRTIMFLWTLWV